MEHVGPGWDRRPAVAFVTGAGGPAGRAAASFLRERKVTVVVADMRPVEEEADLVLLPAAVAPEFRGQLRRTLGECGARLLVPTVTEELPLVAQDREALRVAGCAVFISSPEATRIADDKWLTAEALSRAGVAVPRSLAGGVSRAEILQTLSLPILSKPRRGRGGRGIEIYETETDLPEPSLDRIYQQFLGGEEYDVNLFAEPGGQPSALVVLRKTQLKGGRVGNASAVERTTAPDVAELATAASRALALEGPIDMDVRRNARGHPLILEINARVGANVRAADEVLETLLHRWKEAV